MNSYNEKVKGDYVMGSKKISLLFASGIVLFGMFGCSNNNSSEPSKSEQPYVVTFDGNGGTLISGVEIQTVKSPDEIKVPTYEKFGYNFDGWDKDITKVFSTTTITAKWVEQPDSGTALQINGFTKDENVYSYKVNNNIISYSFINKVTVSNGSTWKLYSDLSGTQEISTKTIQLNVGDNIYYILVTSSKGDLGFYTINIRRLNMFTVEFDTKGGTTIPSQQVQEESFIEPVNNPEKYGYTFSSWDYDFSEPIMENLIVCAIWKANEYNVTLDPNGGYVSTTSVKATFGQSVSLPTPIYKGYTFKGWYYDNMAIVTSYWNIANDVTIVAQWSIIQYQIKYYLYGGNMSSNANPTTYTVESAISSFSSPTRVGYTFKGWFNNPSYDREITSIEKGTIGNMSLHAKWEINNYEVNVEYEQNKGSIIGNDNYDYDSIVSLTAEPAKGYSFAGWSNNGEIVSTETNYSFRMPDHDVNLEAVFNPISYTITYELDDGTNNDNNPDSYTIEDETIVLRDPYKTGHTFSGWHISSIDGEGITSIDPSICENIVLYATWDKNSYTITISFDVEKGSASGEGTYLYGEEVTLKATQIDILYRFIGWYIDDELVSVYSTYRFPMPDKNLSFTAVFDTTAGSEYLFGSYPQAKITNKKTVASLNEEAGPLPTGSNFGSWKDYGYYYNNTLTSYAFYQDITLDGAKYRGVYFTKARYESDVADYGYEVGTVHWFLFQSIKWIVLEKGEHELTMIAARVLDSQSYSINNSVSIFTWLNDSFDKTAFTLSDYNVMIPIKNNQRIRLLSRADFLTYKELCPEIINTPCSNYATSQYLFQLKANTAVRWWLEDRQSSGVAYTASSSGAVETAFENSVATGVRPIIKIVW